ncbi:vq motif-containing protein 22 [Nicotiana attenuata]|uniref:Vq motif-containing protein 22 n=1 Tax=Nicotiana attenuata TaxID=49451 RepID=A0A314KRB1_NICAT|nr:vq motif-containing protein 22 [Nicotiana attenuata]
MDNTIPTSPTDQWEMPYYQQTDFRIANPYECNFSDSTIITTQNPSHEVSISSDHHPYSSNLSPENSSQIAGNDDQLLSPKTSKGKPVRRRITRASKKTPTTLINTSITKFRAVVQQYTGCHTSPIFKNQKGPINLSFGPPTDDVQNDFFGSNSIGEGSWNNYGYYYNHEEAEKLKDKLQQDQESRTSPSAGYTNSGNSKLSVDDYGIW